MARSSTAPVVVEASLDDLRSSDVRFLQEAARLGPLQVRLPSDALVAAQTGVLPMFPAAERLFLAESLRPVAGAAIVDRPISMDMDGLVATGGLLVARDGGEAVRTRETALAHGVPYVRLTDADCAGFPPFEPEAPAAADNPRVVVTGCYDWLHSGHVRFFMDAAAFGSLHVVVGSDRNVELLKGPGHPLQHEDERRYMVSAVRSVYRGMISSGSGWMDAEPEIAEIRPAYYVVNEDGDQVEKRDFCRAHGIEYVVLERKPHAGLEARSSTVLRGPRAGVRSVAGPPDGQIAGVDSNVPDQPRFSRR
jgi:cytidyltransferase-like protein